jgi:hypothetical protein
MKRAALFVAFACLAMPVAAGDAGSKDVDRQIVGAWKLEFTAPDGVHRNPIVIVGRQYKTYTAWYVDGKEPQAFRDVQLQGDKLVGTIEPQEHPGITVTCESKLKAEDQCEGTATFKTKSGGDTGSWTFTGQRIKLSAFDDVMTWKLTFATPDQKSHEATLTVVSKNGKFYAWISTPDHELPARDVTVEGDRVELKLAADTPEGKKVEVTLRGTLSGDEVQGTAEYRVQGETGTFPFKAKRTS